MKQLATINGPAAITEYEPDYTAFLPSWIQYLIAAYPQANISPKTYAVLEEQLQDVDEETLNRAVRRHVARSVFWPAAAELRTVIQALPPEQASRPKYGRFVAQAGELYPDDEIYEIEVRRGTMRPLAEIKNEIERARRELLAALNEVEHG
jgi:hypothetical protein